MARPKTTSKTPPAKKARPGKTPAPAATAVATAPTNRRLKTTKRVSKKEKRAIRAAYPKLPSAFKLFGQAGRLLARNWKPFAGVMLIYILLVLVFVQGFSSGSSVASTKATLDPFTKGHVSELVTSTALFAYMFNETGATTDPTAALYRVLLIFITSLALIWALRAAYDKQPFRVRDGFYRGMYPLVPFVLVLLALGLEVVPLAVGISLYNAILSNGIAVGGGEQLAFIVLSCGLAALTLYWLMTSVFAIYIVCLPDMTPLKALRAARKLVRFRRWAILRKILFLPLALVLLIGLVVVPLIWFVTPAAAWAFLVLLTLCLPYVHSYLYSLYRALL
ncbi:MAG TPA: hypothetical protein VLF91_05115 [Candidatus Saccharimonadales bacterium]|nr:hypothetical protein [Candidatus Saccharimonadales bacterium]